MSRFPKPVDRSLWDMMPQTINAYYDPIDQPDHLPRGDPAAALLRSERRSGRQLWQHRRDHRPRNRATASTTRAASSTPLAGLRDWWTKATAAKYNAHAAGARQAVRPVSSRFPACTSRAQLTLGENLGDLGGLEAAYAAYRRYVARHGEPPVIDGLTGDQRFFIAYGYSWQSKYREDALRSQLLSNSTRPDKYRVNGIVRNFDPWYKAFNVQPGDKLYLPPEQRVHVW